MNMTNVSQCLQKLSSGSSLFLRKHSTEICLGLGVLAGIGTVVLTYRAARKVDAVLVDHSERREDFEQKVATLREIEEEKGISLADSEYTSLAHKKELSGIYLKTGLNLAKDWWPVALTGVLSIGCVLAGYKIMQKRYIGVVAALQATTQAYNALYKRISEDHGEEYAYMAKHGLRKETVEVEETDAKGKTKKVKKEVVTRDEQNPKMYNRIFEQILWDPDSGKIVDGSTHWDPDYGYNHIFLKGQQDFWNWQLKLKGHVFLNKIYDQLGFRETYAGQEVGWFYSEDENGNFNGDGDGYICFGIFDENNQIMEHCFVDGDRNRIMLDFNVDGPMHHKIADRT